jgi:small subunit ribosomal protein S10
MATQKVRVKVKGFDHRTVDYSVKQIIEAAQRTGAVIAGPVPLPTRIEKFCVNRATNIDKDSREQFEIRTHKRLIDILQPTAKTVDALSQLNLPAGVQIDIKLQ